MIPVLIAAITFGPHHLLLGVWVPLARRRTGVKNGRWYRS
jgi:hypothetical protein